MSKPTKVRPVMNSQQKAINVTLVCTGNLNSNKDDDDDHGGTSYENDYFASMQPPTKTNAPSKEVALARIDVLYLLKVRVKVQVLVRQKRKEPEQSPEDPTAGTAKT